MASKRTHPCMQAAELRSKQKSGKAWILLHADTTCLRNCLPY